MECFAAILALQWVMLSLFLSVSSRLSQRPISKTVLESDRQKHLLVPLASTYMYIRRHTYTGINHSLSHSHACTNTHTYSYTHAHTHIDAHKLEKE